MTAAAIASALSIEIDQLFQHPSVRGISSASTLIRSKRVKDRSPADQIGAPPVENNNSSHFLRLLWHAEMKDCVDTPPLCVPTTSTGASVLPSKIGSVVFSASHGGRIACLMGATGAVKWQIDIGNEQPDPGMALLSRHQDDDVVVLVVGLNSGKLLFLDAETGEKMMEDDDLFYPGGLRAAPAASRKGGMAWIAGHGSASLSLLRYSVFTEKKKTVTPLATLPLPF